MGNESVGYTDEQRWNHSAAEDQRNLEIEYLPSWSDLVLAALFSILIVVTIVSWPFTLRCPHVSCSHSNLNYINYLHRNHQYNSSLLMFFENYQELQGSGQLTSGSSRFGMPHCGISHLEKFEFHIKLAQPYLFPTFCDHLALIVHTNNMSHKTDTNHS